MNGTSMDIENRVFLITGGTSGVGKAIASGLAGLGAKIVIVGRSRERGQSALQEIAEATGNERGEFLAADLALQSSIRQASEEFKRRYDGLHVLVNAGGAIYWDRQLTQEGVERMFAVNYLGHFLLTHQLMDMLKGNRPARVITISGNPRFLRNPKLDLNDIQLEKRFSGLRAAAQALYARTFFSFELAKRLEGTGVTSVAFHPGLIKSNLVQGSKWYIRAMTSLINASATANCEIGVYLAAAKEAEAANGVFFDDKKRILPFHETFDEEIGRKLWRLSEKLTGISAM